MYMVNQPDGLNPLATEIQLLYGAVLRPFLLEPPNGLVRLDPEPPESKQESAHGDVWSCPGSCMTTAGASNCGRCNAPRTENFLEPLLQPLP